MADNYLDDEILYYEKMNEYSQEILIFLEPIAEFVHAKLKKQYIENSGGDLNEKLVTAGRYTFDHCDTANIELAMPLIEKIPGVKEVIPISGKFRPFIQRLGKIGQHYALIVHYKDIYFGVDVASAQFGKLPLESVSGQKRGQVLIFPSMSLNRTLDKFSELYGGDFEIGQHEYE